jgi:hypothetical protein
MPPFCCVNFMEINIYCMTNLFIVHELEFGLSIREARLSDNASFQRLWLPKPLHSHLISNLLRCFHHVSVVSRPPVPLVSLILSVSSVPPTPPVPPGRRIRMYILCFRHLLCPGTSRFCARCACVTSSASLFFILSTDLFPS